MRSYLLALMMGVVGVAWGGIYDDAIFWFRGGKTTGTGTDVKLFDEIHASDPSHANHGAAFTGLASSRAIVEEDVTFPCWRDDPLRTKVLRLSCDPQISGTTTNLWLNWANASFLRPQFSNEYTMVMRLKYQAGPTTNSTRWLTRFGYAGGSGGVLFGLRGNDATTNRVLLCCYQTKSSSGTSAYAWGQTSVRIPPTNVWFDVSLVVSNNLLRVGIARPTVYWGKNPIEFTTISANMYPTMTTGNATNWRFFSERGDTAAQSFNSAYDGNFVGSVQQIAIWNRGLSDSEIREAWGTPCEDLWQVGLSNDSSSEFSPDAAPATQTINPYQGGSTVSPRLCSGAVWTVPFHGMTNEVGLAQIFRLTPTSGSADGLVSVSVNGTLIGSKAVRKGKTTEWFAKGELFVGGDNVLTLKRTDVGSSDVVVDAMSLGGSFQIGRLGVGDWSNLSTEGLVDTIPTTRDIARKHWPQANNLNVWSSNRTYRVWVPQSIADRYSTAFGFYVKIYELAATNTASLNLYVNGEHRSLVKISNGQSTPVEEVSGTIGLNRTYFETAFLPGELKSGWNEFSLRGFKVNNNKDTKGYYLFNAYRWFVTSAPPTGTFLFLR